MSSGRNASEVALTFVLITKTGTCSRKKPRFPPRRTRCQTFLGRPALCPLKRRKYVSSISTMSHSSRALRQEGITRNRVSPQEGLRIDATPSGRLPDRLPLSEFSQVEHPPAFVVKPRKRHVRQGAKSRLHPRHWNRGGADVCQHSRISGLRQWGQAVGVSTREITTATRSFLSPCSITIERFDSISRLHGLDSHQA